MPQTYLDDVVGVSVYDSGSSANVRLCRDLDIYGADITYNTVTDRIEIRIGGGQEWKASARLATVGALAAYTRTASAIVANANGAMANVDGVAPAVGDRLLLTSDGTASDVDNGIWDVDSLGSAGTKYELSRSSDWDESTDFSSATTVPVEEGTVKAGHAFRVTSSDPLVLNTDPVVLTDVGLLLGSVGTYDGQPMTWDTGTTQWTARDWAAFGPTPVATAGELRLTNTASIMVRNAANTQDVLVAEVTNADLLALGNAQASNITLTTAGTVATSQPVELGATPAAAGALRMTNNTAIAARNNAGGADITIGEVTNTDQLNVGNANASNIVLTSAGAVQSVVPVEVNLAGAYARLGLVAGSGAGSAAATGGLRMQGNGAAQGRIVFRNVADTGDVAGVSSIADDLYIGGLYPVRPGSIILDAADVRLRRNGSDRLYVANTYLEISTATELRFDRTVANPSYNQEIFTTAGTVGQVLTVNAQDSNSAGAASTGGELHVRAGDGTGANDFAAAVAPEQV
jgi:hypothetical protein